MTSSSSTSVTASSTTTLYSAGSNSDGPLGLSHTNDVHRLTAACQPPAAGQAWQCVVTSGLHTLAVTTAGELYAWGSNSHGQCGLPASDNADAPANVILTPQLVELPTASRVKHIACGWRHTVIVTSSDELYVFGDNSSGQLGLAHTSNTICTPTRLLLPLPATAHVVSIATGWQHTICVTADGCAYSWGKNNKGQLGVPVDTSHKLPYLPTQIAHSDGVKFCKVICGWQFTVLLAETRTEVYATGSNQHGQLCIPPTELKHSGGQLLRIDLPLHAGELVLDIKCGWSHCLCLTSQHRVFAWGRNDKGQCGVVSDDRYITIPALVELAADESACSSRIACGSEHSLIATDECLYGCGWNEHGNLALGTDDQLVTSPTLIPVKLGGTKRILQLEAAGAVTMLLVSETG